MQPPPDKSSDSSSSSSALQAAKLAGNLPPPAPPPSAFARQVSGAGSDFTSKTSTSSADAADAAAAAAAAAARAVALGRLTSSLSDLASLAAGARSSSCNLDRQSDDGGGGGGGATDSAAAVAAGDRSSRSSNGPAGGGGAGGAPLLSPAADARVGHILQLACSIFRCSDAAVLLEDGCGSLLTARAVPPSRLVRRVAAEAAASASAEASNSSSRSGGKGDDTIAGAASAPAPAAPSLLAWLSSSAAAPFIPETPRAKAGDDETGDDDDDDNSDLEGDEASASAATARQPPSSSSAAAAPSVASTVIAVADLSADERFEAPLVRRELFERGGGARRRSMGNDATPLAPRDRQPPPLPRFFAAAALVSAASGRRLGTLAIADAAPFPLPSDSNGNGGGDGGGDRSVPPPALAPSAGCPPARPAPAALASSAFPSSPPSSSSSPLTAAESALLASLADMVARGLAADAAVASARARGAALLTMVDSGAPPYLIVEVCPSAASRSPFPSARNGGAAAEEEEGEDEWRVVHASPAAAALLLPPPAAAATKADPPSSSSSSSPSPPLPSSSLIPRNAKFWELLVPAVASCSSAAAAAAATAAAATAAAVREPPRPFMLRGLCSAAAAAAAAAEAAARGWGGGKPAGCSILTAKFTPATVEEEREATSSSSADEAGEQKEETRASSAAGGGGEVEGGEGIERMRRLLPAPTFPPSSASSSAPPAADAQRRLFRVELTVAHATTAVSAEIPPYCYGDSNGNAPNSSVSASAASSLAHGKASANPFGDQLSLGPLLGQGSHGRVFLGEWRGRRVAVKVARAAAVRRHPGDGAPVEAVVAAPPCHRGVVACFAAADSPALERGGCEAAAAQAKEEEEEEEGAAGGGEEGDVDGGSTGNKAEDATLGSRASSGLFMRDSASSTSCEARAAVAEAAARAKLESGTGETATTTASTTTTTTAAPLPPVVDSSPRPSNSNSSSEKQRRAAAASETWFVLELCDGGTLAEALGRGVFRLGAPGRARDSDGDDGRRRPPSATALVRARSAAATAADVAEALCWLHSRGVSHGDLTCSNVLLCSLSSRSSTPGEGDENGEDEGDTRPFRVKISDFGLALDPAAAAASAASSPAAAAPAPPLSSRSPSLLPPHGTVTHMPPERLARGPPSPQADVFSLGVLLWSMLAASRPWAGLAAQVVRRVGIEGLSLPVPPPPDGCAGSAELEAVLRGCLERDPSRRPGAGEAARRLREAARRLI